MWATLVTLVLYTCTANSKLVREARAGYTATVVEFAPTSAEPLHNIEEYKTIAQRANNSGSQIIVFPEYGLTGTEISEDRAAARSVSHEVPAPSLQLVPCDEYHSGLGYQIVGQLSCIAKENGMYVVANLIEKSECANCSGDSLLLFNTNVVFDRAGVVVARYRKYNLFFEVALNQTEEPEYSYFDSDFGPRFGLITCFDIMFEEPAVTLVREYEVTEVIFPTAWIHELPFLTAVQTQSLWSYAMNVNFLGSGFSDPSTGKGGSGLYEARTGVLVHATPWQASSLPLTETFDAMEHSLTPKAQNQKNKIEPPYYYQEDLTNYTTQLINLTVKNYEVCHNEFCCNVEIEATIHDTTVLRVIAFDGERSYGGGFYTKCKVQTCGVIRCQQPEDPVKNCGLIMSGIAQKFSLTYIKVWATFSADAVIGPSIVNGELGILTGDQINFIEVKGENSSDYSLELVQPITENILTFALWGRVFPKEDVPSNVVQTMSYVAGGLLLGFVLTSGLIALFYHHG